MRILSQHIKLGIVAKKFLFGTYMSNEGRPTVRGPTLPAHSPIYVWYYIIFFKIFLHRPACLCPIIDSYCAHCLLLQHRLSLFQHRRLLARGCTLYAAIMRRFLPFCIFCRLNLLWQCQFCLKNNISQKHATYATAKEVI